MVQLVVIVSSSPINCTCVRLYVIEGRERLNETPDVMNFRKISYTYVGETMWNIIGINLSVLVTTGV